MSTLNRYPGSRPFTREYKELFFGRDEDIKELCTLAKVEKLTVLFGKSGLGKSSLLNAGVLPKLEAEDDYLSIPVRLNSYVEENPQIPLEIFTQKITEYKPPVALLNKIQDEDISLWQFIKEIQFQNKNYQRILFVFDQFEELFTYPNGVEDFAQQLAELLNNRMPRSFRRNLRGKIEADAQLLTDEEWNFIEQPLNLGVLISIRSDKLNLLHRLADQIPAILRNCYELNPLSREQACTSIIKPSQKEDKEFKSKRFVYTAEALDKMLDYLTHNNEKSVESFQLQILCQFAENIVIDQNKTEITASDLGNLESIYQNYYDDQIKQVGTPEEQQASRIFIEDGLIFEEEERRISLFEGLIHKNYGIRPELLRRLVETRLIRSEQNTSGGFSYELSHDTLVAPILKAKARRREKEEKEAQLREERKREEESKRQAKIKKRKFFVLLFILCLGAFVVMMLQAYYIGKVTIANNKAEYNVEVAKSAKKRAESAKKKAISAKKGAEEILKASQLTILTLREEKSDPTVALRLAQETLNLTPEDSGLYSDLLQVISENYAQNAFYKQVFTHKKSVNSVAISPNGKYAVTGSDDKTTKLWNLEQNDLRTLLGHRKRVIAVTFSPDSNYVLTGSADKTAKLWDLEGNELALFSGHKDRVHSVAFSPDGKSILTGSADKTAKHWDLDGNQHKTFKGHDEAVYAVAFSPDGNYVLTGSADKTAILWDIKGDKIRSFEPTYKCTEQFLEDLKQIVIGNPEQFPNDVLEKLKSIKNSEAQGKEQFLEAFKSTIGEPQFLKYESRILRMLESDKVKGHSGTINSVAFAPDGESILTGSADETAILWDLAGNERQVFSEHEGVVTSVAFSPVDRSILTASGDNTARRWDFKGKELRRFSGHKEKVSSVAFSSDGASILTGSGDNTAKLWDLKSEQVLKFHKRSPVTSVAFSASGKHICVGTHSGRVKLWNLTNQTSEDFDVHSKIIYALTFSPDSRFILTGSGDHTAKLLALNGSVKRTLRGHTGLIKTVAFSPDGQKVLTGSADTTIKLWDLNTKETQTFNWYGDRINSVVFSPDGTYIVAGSQDGNTVKLWDLKNSEMTEITGHEGRINSVVFSPDSQTLLTGSDDNTARLWDLEGNEKHKFEGHSDEVWSVAFSPYCKYILTGSPNRKGTHQNEDSIILWDFGTKDRVRTFKGHNREFSLSSLAFSPDGESFLAASDDGTAKLWNLNGELVRTFKDQGHNARVSSIAYSGGLFLTGSADKTAILWDSTGKIIQTFEGHSKRISAVFLSPDGKSILTGSDDGTAKLWNRSGDVDQTFQHSNNVNLVALSRDGSYVFSGSDDGSAMLRNRNGDPVHPFESSGKIISCAFSPDGNYILTGNADGTANLWDLNKMKLEHTFDSSGPSKGKVNSCAFSPDGNYILTGNADGTANLWDLNKKKLEYTIDSIRSSRRSVNSAVAFSPDGNYILHCKSNKTAKLSDMNGQYICEFKVGFSINSVAFSPDNKFVVIGDTQAKFFNTPHGILQSQLINNLNFKQFEEFGIKKNFTHFDQYLKTESRVITLVENYYFFLKKAEKFHKSDWERRFPFFEKAVKLAEKVFTLSKNAFDPLETAGIYKELAKCHLYVGAYSESEKYVLKAVELNAALDETSFNHKLALIYLCNGKLDKAKTLYKKVKTAQSKTRFLKSFEKVVGELQSHRKKVNMDPMDEFKQFVFEDWLRSSQAKDLRRYGKYYVEKARRVSGHPKKIPYLQQSVQFYEKAFNLSEGKSPKYTSTLSRSYCLLAYSLLYSEDPDSALTFVIKGDKLKGSHEWIQAISAPCYLYAGQFQEAKGLYSELKEKTWHVRGPLKHFWNPTDRGISIWSSTQPYNPFLKQDLLQLERIYSANSDFEKIKTDVEKIKKLLSIEKKKQQSKIPGKM